MVKRHHTSSESTGSTYSGTRCLIAFALREVCRRCRMQRLAAVDVDNSPVSRLYEVEGKMKVRYQVAVSPSFYHDVCPTAINLLNEKRETKPISVVSLAGPTIMEVVGTCGGTTVATCPS